MMAVFFVHFSFDFKKIFVNLYPKIMILKEWKK